MNRLFKLSTHVVFSVLMLGAVLLLAAPKSIDAQVTIDGTFNAAAFDGLTGVSTLSWQHTVNGTNRALLIGVSTSATNAGSALERVTSVTYGTQALTRVTNGFRVSPDLRNAVEMFLLVNPPISTRTITVNLTPVAANYVVGGSISFTGVNQINPTGAFVSATNALNVPSSSATVVVTDSTPTDMVLDVIAAAFDAQNLIPAAGQNRAWRNLSDPPTPPPFYVGAGSTKPGASPTVSMSWTLQFAQNWALGAIAVKAAPPSTAADVTISGRALTASGKAVSRAFIILTDSTGARRTTLTNPSGYYRFLNVPSGATYIFTARSKRYTFNPKVLSVVEENDQMNLVANP